MHLIHRPAFEFSHSALYLQIDSFFLVFFSFFAIVVTASVCIASNCSSGESYFLCNSLLISVRIFGTSNPTVTSVLLGYKLFQSSSFKNLSGHLIGDSKIFKCLDRSRCCVSNRESTAVSRIIFNK